MSGNNPEGLTENEKAVLEAWRSGVTDDAGVRQFTSLGRKAVQAINASLGVSTHNEKIALASRLAGEGKIS